MAEFQSGALSNELLKGFIVAILFYKTHRCFTSEYGFPNFRHYELGKWLFASLYTYRQVNHRLYKWTATVNR